MPPVKTVQPAPAPRSFAAMRHPRFSRAVFDLCDRDDGRQYRARHQLLGAVSEISFAGAGGLRRACRTGCRSLRFPSRPVRSPTASIRAASFNAACGLFIIASLGWGYFFITDTLQMWHAMVLLVIHGCAGVLWQTPNQLLLYDIVGREDLMSAVRLNATARYVGVLIGPAVGGVILLALGPAHGILLNTLFYLPLVLWLVNAPYGPKFRIGARAAAARRARARRHRADGARHRRASGHHRDDAAWRAPRRSLSAMPIARKCRASHRISAMAIRACRTACCWRPMPPARSLPASCSRAGRC